MKTLKRKAPYRDKNGTPLFNGDLCRTWITDENEEKSGGSWLYERVQYHKGKWYLFELDFDYKNSTEKPVLLKDYCHKIEVIKRLSVTKP